MLHSISPDLEAADPDVTPDDEDTLEDQMERRYSAKGLNSTEPRFCGPGMATAALVTRFHQGLPMPLQQLPDTTRIVTLIRNPVDIVVARVQASGYTKGEPGTPLSLLSYE